jgi:glycosyltransferase involved in cell wall biosynthesis
MPDIASHAISMAGKIKVGIRFVDHKTWTGGVYYLVNLVSALRSVKDRDQYDVVVFVNQTDLEKAKTLLAGNEVRYFVIDRTLPVYQRILNKISKALTGNYIYSALPGERDADVIFPNADAYYFGRIKTRIFWIPDFQEAHYPAFFTEQDLSARKKLQQKIARDQKWLVLSSESAKADFVRLYPDSEISIHILRFAVLHPEYKHLEIEKLRNKFGLPANYFFSPNQFWVHKDHMTVIKAVEQLKKSGIETVVAFSGKEDDYRNPGYTESLKKYVTENNLSSNILFLGFLDRAEQLQLMNHAQAIVQPSLFEGWSTVVEDAKAMSQLILASGLDVHHEQLDSWGGTSAFFDIKDFSGLAVQLKNVIEGKLERKSADYNANIARFGSDFVNIINAATK